MGNSDIPEPDERARLLGMTISDEEEMEPPDLSRSPRYPALPRESGLGGI
jgi:hypothetical protein